MSARDLIWQSIATRSIVHAPWSADLEADLLVESEDQARCGEALEFWSDGWRAHLDGATPFPRRTSPPPGEG